MWLCLSQPLTTTWYSSITANLEEMAQQLRARVDFLVKPGFYITSLVISPWQDTVTALKRGSWVLMTSVTDLGRSCRGATSRILGQPLRVAHVQ